MCKIPQQPHYQKYVGICILHSKQGLLICYSFIGTNKAKCKHKQPKTTELRLRQIKPLLKQYLITQAV